MHITATLCMLYKCSVDVLMISTRYNHTTQQSTPSMGLLRKKHYDWAENEDGMVWLMTPNRTEG